MPAPATIADFLGLICKSGLLEPKQLDGYLDRLRQSKSLPGQPASLAAQLVRDGLLTNFQAEQLLGGRCKGFVLGKYRLLDRLGAGGMGTVFRAEHVRMRRPVALKVLSTERANDPVYRARFLREAQAVAALDHPNIVHAYDVETEGTVCFLVMELVDGVDLHELVRRCGRLDPTRAARYVRQAALGLQHAHEAGLIHRDIKPANVLVNRAGVVKILDMGLARFFQDDSDRLTKEHDGESILGTADYLAPEQGRDSHGVDIRADIYSLGATFFYLLIGQAPFADGTLNQKLIWHQMRPAPDVQVLRPDVPRELAALVARMLAKDPRQRPQTPGEVAAALLPWTQTPSAAPKPEELPESNPELNSLHEAAPTETSSSLLPAAASRAAENATSVTTDLDLASASRTTSSLPVVSSSPLRVARVERSWMPTGRRRAAWYGIGALLLLALTGSGVGWVCLRYSTPPVADSLIVPSAPTQLRASQHETGAIELQWKMPAGRDATVRIERAVDRAFQRERTTVATVANGVTRYVDTAAPRDKPCCYRLFAIGEGGESSASEPAWPPPSFGRGFAAGRLALNGGAAIAGNVLRLTDTGGNQARSAFYLLPMVVRRFKTSFRFQLSPGNTADGFTFCIQGLDPRRIGTEGNGLGYQGLGLSVAVKFDLWDNEGEGRNSTGLFTGGMNPTNSAALDLTPSGIDLHSGRPYDVELIYEKKLLNLTIRDGGEPARVFRRRFTVDIPDEVQDTTAYVGFTASTGGIGAVQDIVNWTWEP